MKKKKKRASCAPKSLSCLKQKLLKISLSPQRQQSSHSAMAPPAEKVPFSMRKTSPISFSRPQSSRSLSLSLSRSCYILEDSCERRKDKKWLKKYSAVSRQSTLPASFAYLNPPIFEFREGLGKNLLEIGISANIDRFRPPINETKPITVM